MVSHCRSYSALDLITWWLVKLDQLLAKIFHWIIACPFWDVVSVNFSIFSCYITYFHVVQHWWLATLKSFYKDIGLYQFKVLEIVHNLFHELFNSCILVMYLNSYIFSLYVFNNLFLYSFSGCFNCIYMFKVIRLPTSFITWQLVNLVSWILSLLEFSRYSLWP